jgi:hypothetical protein
MCVIKAFPEDIRNLAAQCIYLPVAGVVRGHFGSPIPDEMRTLLDRWDDPGMPDDARAKLNHFLAHYQGQDWYYAVKHADEGEGEPKHAKAIALMEELAVELSPPQRIRLAKAADLLKKETELRALLLDADVEMTDEGRALLSDFVWRHEIKGRFNRSWDMKARARLARAEWKKRRARPATPIYARSAVDAKIDCALAELRAWRHVFGRARVPVDHMAKLWGMSASTLQNALEGRRGSERRKAARRKGKLPRRKSSKPMPRPADRGKG